MVNSIMPQDGEITRLMRDFETLVSTDFWNNIPYQINSKTRLKITGILPKVDVIENDEELKIVFDVHGYKKDDFKLTVNELENKLTFRTGKMNSYDEDTKQKDSKYILREIKQSTSQRVIEFPSQLDLSRIKSNYNDGYLICTIPYASKKKDERELMIE